MIPSEPAPSDDPAALQAMLAAERVENERLRKIIRELQRHRFGRRAESLPLDQLQLGLEEAEQAEAADEAVTEATAASLRAVRVAKRRANRGALPAHLPRIETVVDIADDSCPCCSGPLHRIGEDVSERLDVVPAQFRVLVIRRPKYACRACTDGVAQAPAPARLIEGGLPTDATVAQVLVSKYADHLPLYRQAQIFARQGVNLDRSTLADWVGRAALLLEPVHGRLFDHLKASMKLFADETTAPVLDPGRGRTKTGQLWAYARDDRPWGGADPPAVAYVYAPDRKAERPMTHLAGFTGVLQVDGYEGYRALTKGDRVKLAFCWAHVRRGFIDLAAKGASPIAAEVLKRIAALYRIEGEIAGLSAEARRQARQDRSRPLLTALERFLRDKLALISQKSTLAVAIRYATSRWDGLTLYADDGRVEMDSNTVERSIRPLALTRKNTLFAGSDRGGQPQHGLEPLNGASCGVEALEASDLRHICLYPEMATLDPLLEVLGDVMDGVAGQQAFLPRRREGRRINAGAIRADPVGRQQGTVLQRLAKEAFGGIEGRGDRLLSRRGRLSGTSARGRGGGGGGLFSLEPADHLPRGQSEHPG